MKKKLVKKMIKSSRRLLKKEQKKLGDKYDPFSPDMFLLQLHLQRLCGYKEGLEQVNRNNKFCKEISNGKD